MAHLAWHRREKDASLPSLVTVQEAEWLFGIPAADALAHPERVLEGGNGWRGVLVSGVWEYVWRAGGLGVWMCVDTRSMQLVDGEM